MKKKFHKFKNEQMKPQSPGFKCQLDLPSSEASMEKDEAPTRPGKELHETDEKGEAMGDG